MTLSSYEFHIWFIINRRNTVKQTNFDEREKLTKRCHICYGLHKTSTYVTQEMNLILNLLLQLPPGSCLCVCRFYCWKRHSNFSQEFCGQTIFGHFGIPSSPTRLHSRTYTLLCGMYVIGFSLAFQWCQYDVWLTTGCTHTHTLIQTPIKIEFTAWVERHSKIRYVAITVRPIFFLLHLIDRSLLVWAWKYTFSLILAIWNSSSFWWFFLLDWITWNAAEWKKSHVSLYGAHNKMRGKWLLNDEKKHD